MDKKGFTLVELLIAMVVGLIIMAAIYGMMNLGQQSSASVDRRVLTQQDARAVLDLLSMEIRMASFNPRMNSTNTIWEIGPYKGVGEICPGIAFTSTKKVRKGIQNATNDANSEGILVAMDLDEDNNIGYPQDNEYITYAFDKNNKSITRRNNCNGAEVILGGADSSTSVANNATGTRMFQYFDGAGTDISNDVTSADEATANSAIRLIRRIRITIVADVQTEGSKFKTSRRTYSTDVLVRNHVLSP